MHLLNKAYDELRQRLADAENKSKYDVLVQAKEYIQALATICEKFDKQQLQQQQQYQQSCHKLESTQSSPVDMTKCNATTNTNNLNSLTLSTSEKEQAYRLIRDHVNNST